MARFARIIIPHLPHHVTQRGNRRQTTFFEDAHYEYYLSLLHYWCAQHNVTIISFCLMPNHVHLILIPADPLGITKAMVEVHQRYTRRINLEKDWRGHLWQGRYYSVPLDDDHLENAICYVEMNPVRAGICATPTDYRWSSAKPIQRSPDFYSRNIDCAILRKMTSTGRPEGSSAFRDRVLELTGFDIQKKKSGRPLENRVGVP